MLGRESLGGKEEEIEVFKRSKKTVRSPKEGEAIGEWRKLLREMKEEIKEGIEEVRKEIREIAEGQREAIRAEIEEMREDLKRREERWRNEREEIKEKIERMEKELREVRVGKAREGKAGERKGVRESREG